MVSERNDGQMLFLPFETNNHILKASFARDRTYNKSFLEYLLVTNTIPLRKLWRVTERALERSLLWVVGKYY
jgi:hypothetical protein